MIRLSAITTAAVAGLFFVFDLVLQIFTIVACLFGIYVMIGLIAEWTLGIFKGKGYKVFPSQRGVS